MDADFDIRTPRTDGLSCSMVPAEKSASRFTSPSPLTHAAGATGGVQTATVASLTQATTRLREARRLLRDHPWEECVGTCPKVLENIDAMNPLPTEA
jgi:hypothetical protein